MRMAGWAKAAYAAAAGGALLADAAKSTRSRHIPRSAVLPCLVPFVKPSARLQARTRTIRDWIAEYVDAGPAPASSRQMWQAASGPDCPEAEKSWHAVRASRRYTASAPDKDVSLSDRAYCRVTLLSRVLANCPCRREDAAFRETCTWQHFLAKAIDTNW